MGFYDYRCHATGLSLRAENAVAVLMLEEPRGTWVPASLPVKGRYNRLGTIDGITADFHSKLLAENFGASVESKRVVLKGEAGGAWKRPGTDFYGHPLAGIDLVLTTIERATSLGPADCKLSGRALNHTLIHAGFYEAAMRALTTPEPDLNTTAMLERAFPFEPSRWFLRELPELTTIRPEVRAALHAFHAFSEFLVSRVKWMPSRGMGQHGSIETVEGFATAFARFGDVPWARAAIERAEIDAENENTDLPDRWLRHSRCSWFGLALNEDRFVATSPEGVRQVLDTFIADEAALFADQLELFVVQEGVPGSMFDLRPILRVKAGESIARFSEKDAAEALSVEDGATVVYQWDEVAQTLPTLAGRVLPAGAPAVFRVGEPEPKWLLEEEKYAPLIHFGNAAS